MLAMPVKNQELLVKKTYGYQERDENKREEFKRRLSKIEPQRRVYVDESGFDNREDSSYGYSPKGERCYALKSGKRTERVSWITALRDKTLLAPLTFEGSCNRDLFETWLANCLIPQLNPGDIIIIDNATFHRGAMIQELVEAAGCEIWYLPSYSPDLNKIENWWAVLKTLMRQSLKEYETVRDCVDAAFKQCPNVCAQRYMQIFFMFIILDCGFLRYATFLIPVTLNPSPALGEGL